MKLKLKTPILFSTAEELKEAVGLGLEYKGKYLDGTYKLPMVQGIEHRDHTYLRDIDPNWDLYKSLPNAKHWADVREEYLPKPWYEKPENIGKLIWVRDDEVELVSGYYPADFVDGLIDKIYDSIGSCSKCIYAEGVDVLICSRGSFDPIEHDFYCADFEREEERDG